MRGGLWRGSNLRFRTRDGRGPDASHPRAGLIRALGRPSRTEGCPIMAHAPSSSTDHGSWVARGTWGAMRCTVPSDDADGCRPETAKEVASPAEMLHAGALSSSHQEVGRPGHGPHDLQPCPSCRGDDLRLACSSPACWPSSPRTRCVDAPMEPKQASSPPQSNQPPARNGNAAGVSRRAWSRSNLSETEDERFDVM